MNHGQGVWSMRKASGLSKKAQRPTKTKKVVVIGLDCADPKLVFEILKNDLPNLKMMMDNGLWANLRSVIPPITIPAWLCMATGKDPGALGLYGFRHRRGHSYKDYWIANSKAIEDPTVWDLAGKCGLRSDIVGFPPSFPPRPLNGKMISCFITPDAEAEYTYPPELKKEVRDLVGEYIFDITFRTDQKDQIKKELWDMTHKHLKVVEHLIAKPDWDLFWYVEIGTDRLHHAFWKYHDPAHSKHRTDPIFSKAILDYYKLMDDAIGRILRKIPEDTIVLVVSDHGAKPMDGVVAINEWLIKEDYLVLKNTPARGSKLEDAQIDWDKTKAWGWGGYYARIFFNVKGRETKGIVDPKALKGEIVKLRKKLEAMKGPTGSSLKNKTHVPEEIYETCKGDVPDLMVFFGDLAWRSAGTLGWGEVFLPDNDTGPDDAMHDWEGILIAYDPKRKLGKKLPVVSILDIAPTILKLMGIKLPKGLKGRSIKEIIP